MKIRGVRRRKMIFSVKTGDEQTGSDGERWLLETLAGAFALRSCTWKMVLVRCVVGRMFSETECSFHHVRVWQIFYILRRVWDRVFELARKQVNCKGSMVCINLLIAK